MIKLNKGGKPHVLIENEATWNAEYVAYVTQNVGTAECATRHRHPQIRSAVISGSHGKCIYCEERILSSQFGDVEHIRPKKVYPHDYVTWNNLAHACTRCNNAKGQKEGFINPFEEEPRLYIEFRGPMLFFRHGDQKGMTTVRGIKLNRAALLEKRAKALESFINKIELMYSSSEPIRSIILDEILVDIQDDAEFAGLLRAYYDCTERVIV